MRWGILGTGRIARTFAAALRASGPAEELLAVACRSGGEVDRPEDFAGALIFNGYARLLEHSFVDTVYVATPHAFHREWAGAALAAGKHVLCEKPIGMSAEDAIYLMEVARQADRFLAEGYMYRFGPLVRTLCDLVQSAAVGRICIAEAGLGNRVPRNLGSRLFSLDLGGGAILDLGGYPMSIVRLVAGVQVGKPFADPVALTGVATFGPTGVDEYAAATLAFSDGLVAQIRCGITVPQDNELRLWGEEGVITVTSPFFAGIPHRPSGKIVACTHDGHRHEMSFADASSPFLAEINGVSAAIAAGRREPAPRAMSWADTVGNMLALDRWRETVRPTPGR